MNDNLSWAQDDIEGMTIDALVIWDIAVPGEDDIDEDDIIDDQSNDVDQEE